MAKEPVGVQMAAEGVGAFVRDMRKAEGAYDKATGAFGKGSSLVASAVGGMTSAVGKVGNIVLGVGKALATVAVTGVAAFGAAVGAAALALGKLALQAAPLEGIGIAFDKMSQRVGLSLDAMRQAAAGTISDFDLMKSANVALTGAGDALGREFGAKLPGLLAIARASAKATGQDVGFMFESLVTGIKRTSPMLIDNTGLQLKLGEANQALADSLGKTVAELTGEEKQIALLNATLEAGQVMVDDFGGGQLTAAERMAQFRAQVQNTKDQVGLALLPALQALLVPITNLVTGVGPKLIEWAEKAGDVLGTAIPFAVDAVRNALSGNLPVAMSNARAAIATVFGPEAALKFNEFAIKIGEAMATARGFIEGTLLPVFESVRTWVETNWPIIRDTVLSAIEAIRAWFVTNWPIIRDTVLSAVEAIRAWFVTNWPIIQAVAVTAWTVIKDVVLAVTDVFVNQVWPSLQSAFASIEGIMETFGISWGDVWDAVKLAVGAVAAVIGAILLALVGVIAGVAKAVAKTLEFVGKTFESMAAHVKQYVEGLAGIIGGAFAVIRGIFTGDTALIRAGFEGWWRGIKNLVSGMLGGIVDTFKLIFGTLLTLVSGFIEGFIGFFQSLYDRLIGHSLIPDMLSDIATAISTAWDGIISNVALKIDDIIAAVAAKWDDIVVAGENIVAAIKAGIAGAWEGFITWLLGKLGGIADLLPFSEPKDPNSPLRNLSKAGEAIVGNIAVGFDTGAAQFASSLAGLMATTGPMMAAAPRLAPAMTSTSTTHVNINTGDIVNGMDVAQLRAFILQTVGEAI